jgi:exopolysaccharide production protein ExoZ
MSNDPAKAAEVIHFHTSLPLPSKIRQIDALQVLRAVAVSLVAWAHVSIALSSIGQPTPNFGIFGIDIFFVISGFIMSYIVLSTQAPAGPAAAWGFFRRRLIRIYPVYWIFVLLQIIRALHQRTLFQHNYIPAFFLLPLPNATRFYDLSWTLMYEMFFYSAIAIILMVTVRRAVPVAIAILSISALAGTVLGLHGSAATILCNPMLLEFTLGAAIAIAHRHFGTRRSPGIIALILGIAASLYLRAYPPAGATSMWMILSGDSVLSRVATWGLAAALIVGGTVFWSPSITTRAGILAVIVGNASYSAYLCSPLVTEFALRVLLKTHPSIPLSFASTLLYQTILVLVILTAGWLSYQFIEWPLVRKIQAKL